MLLLLTALVPAREPLRMFGRDADEFYMPANVYWTAWCLMAAGYSFSGVVKLSSPSWVDGTALVHVMQNPLARAGWLRDAALSLPLWLLRLSTWAALALEISFLPLALRQGTRAAAWLGMALMHIGILAVVSFADLSGGMLMAHFFTYDPRWRQPTRRNIPSLP